MRKIIVFMLTISILFVLYGISVAGTLLELRTPAELSNWTVTTSSQEVIDYCIEVAKLSRGKVRFEVAGYTSMGKPIPMLIIGTPAPNKPSEMGDRSSVFINCNIHSGEVEGKESMLIFAREAALGQHDELLKRIVVLIFPNMNADGNDFLGTWRIRTQPTPELVGTRYTAQGYNLNRDFSKMEGFETRALYKVFREWNPVLFVDAHATNGSRMRHVVSWSWGYHPNTNAELQHYNRTTFEVNAFGPDSYIGRKYNGERTLVPYGNFTGTTTKVVSDDQSPTGIRVAFDLVDEYETTGSSVTWDTYGDLPRYTTNLSALGNRLGCLLECYSYDDYDFRVQTQYASIYGAIDAVAKDLDHILALIKNKDDEAISWKANGLPDIDISLESAMDRYAGADGLRSIDSYVFYPGNPNAQGRYSMGTVDLTRPVTYRMIEKQLYVPTLTAKMGALYIFQSGSHEAVKLLLRHGIEVMRVTKDTEVPDHFRFRISSITPSATMYEGHWPNGRTQGYFSYTGIDGAWVASTASNAPDTWNPLSNSIIQVGDFVVSTSQRRGVLAALLLEPQCNDGLFYWNYFDDMIRGERGTNICPMIKVNNYSAIPESSLEIVTTVPSEWDIDKPDDIGTIPDSILDNLPSGVEAGFSSSFIEENDEAQEIMSGTGGTTKKENKYYYLDDALAFAKSKLSGGNFKSALSMPIFKFFVSADGNVGVVTLMGIDGASLLASIAKNVKLMALTNTGGAELLELVFDPADLADGKFIITTADGYILQPDDPIPDYLQFDITVALKDGGKFDLVSAPLVVGASLVFIETGATLPPKPGTSGCAALPLVAIILLFAVMPFILKK